uniref:F-box domain-containing protein n=1 Tax=Chenopodium quinoa TaxID=63459 RepID=A0A803LLA8_CHEQI
MADLPTPLITIILSKLPAKSLLRFRCVAKSWRSLIDEQHFINLHLKNSSQNPTHQTLIIKDSFLQKDTNFTSKDPFLYSLDYPTLKRATLINCPFDCDSAETQIVGSCDGLLCLADGIAAYIFNPATRKHRVLPVTPVEIPGEGVFLNGCLHWLVVKKPISKAVDVLVALDIGTEEHRVLPIPEYNELKMDYYSNVGVIYGCISIRVFYPNNRLDVWIMKEYGVKESWTKWFSIPQRENIGFFSCLKPIVYLKKNGSKELLFEKDFKEFVWFDVKQQIFKDVNTRGLPWSLASALLVESLIPLDSPKKKKPVNKKRHDLDGFLSKGFKLKL